MDKCECGGEWLVYIENDERIERCFVCKNEKRRHVNEPWTRKGSEIYHDFNFGDGSSMVKINWDDFWTDTKKRLEGYVHLEMYESKWPLPKVVEKDCRESLASEFDMSVELLQNFLFGDLERLPLENMEIYLAQIVKDYSYGSWYDRDLQVKKGLAWVGVTVFI